MRERVLEVGKQSCLVKELGCLQIGETAAKRVIRHLGKGLEQREGYVLADDGCSLDEALIVGREPVDACGQDRLDRHRDPEWRQGSGELVGSSLPGQHLRFDERSHALFEKEGIAVGALDQHPRERSNGGVGSEQRLKQVLRPLRRQRIDPDVSVVAPGAPVMPILRPVIHQQQHPGAG